MTKKTAKEAVFVSAPPIPIVGIGASAGGLEALELFLSHVPVGSGMAFVVIQHLDPERKGMMAELLQRITPMAVVQAKNRMAVQADCVYIIPPKHDLSILHDHLYLLEPSAPRGLRLPVDFFFRALAEDRGERAIGVVLSGMGSDGTFGVRAIKERGGWVAVQDPASAKFSGMPQSAIDSGMADLVAPAEQLPLCIKNHLGQANLAGSSEFSGSSGSSEPSELSPGRYPAAPAFGDVEPAMQQDAFTKVCILLRERSGHDFSLYKKTTLYRRIERRMAVHKIGRTADYIRYLRENPQEVDMLFRELLIGVTSFFRDPAVWHWLEENALPEMLAHGEPGGVLRAWVAGCSTGEEAYSLAILFRELETRQAPSSIHSALQIFATDLDPDAIAKARQGRYPASIADAVSAERLGRFFVKDGTGYRVGKEIREMVVFAPQSVIVDPPFTKLDILTCRNLLIYLGTELQRKLLPLFHYSLNPGGILVLGSAESISSADDLFTPLDAKARIFRRTTSVLRSPDLDFPTRQMTKHSGAPMENIPQPPTDNLQGIADQMLLQQFSPTAVLVTAAGDLVYISGRTGKYIEAAAGKVNWNIHAMARDELRQEIAVALPKALQSGERVICHHIKVGSNGSSHWVDLTVQPIAEPAALRGMAMLVFTDVPAAPETLASLGEATVGKRLTRRGQREDALEESLARAHQDRLSLREEMQASQEELKSANEELQSTNEELQSANEELTTSKEEMQSLNEELQTVNSELQAKLDALSAAENDMNNLLNSTDIVTVFLDNALRVRRFTTQATRLFKLIPGDLGRPLSDIVTDLVYPDLQSDADQVLQTLAFTDREVTTLDGRWFQVKIMPYRTSQNVIDGVVITLNDISVAKRLEARLRDVGGKG